jgi:hypothetical protein
MSFPDDSRSQNKQYFCDCPEHCKRMKKVSQSTFFRHSKYREPTYRDWYANRRDAISEGTRSIGPQRTDGTTASSSLTDLTTSTSVTVVCTSSFMFICANQFLAAISMQYHRTHSGFIQSHNPDVHHCSMYLFIQVNVYLC